MVIIRKKIILITSIIFLLAILMISGGYILADWQGGTAVTHIQSTQRGGLVGYWNMDNGDINGTTVYDKATGSNDLTLSGSYTTGVSGKKNEAVRFPGTDGSNFASNSNNTITGSSSFTMSAWINKQSSKSTVGGAVSFGSTGTGNSAWMGLSSAGVIWGAYYAQNLSTGVTAVDNTWYHVVQSYNQSTGYTDVYVNGTRYVHSNAYTPNISGTTICVGSIVNVTSNIFPGDVDDVRIYNRTLSENEIINLYNSTTKTNNVQSVSRSGLTYNLNFGNNDDTDTVYETSGNGLNVITAQGTPIFYSEYVDFNGTNAYLIGSSTAIYNTASTTIAVKFSPDSDWSDDTTDYLYDSSLSSRYYVNKIKATGNYTLNIAMGDTLIAEIPTSTYSPYWKVGQENIIIVSGVSGDTNVWLNGNQILTNDNTAWTPANPSDITIGQIISGTGYFDGKIYYMKVWDRILTSKERDILNADRVNYKK